jgi:hypothetical protein
MRTALKTLSIITVVLGGFAIIGATSSTTLEDAMYALVGGLYFVAQSTLTLFYIAKNK